MVGATWEEGSLSRLPFFLSFIGRSPLWRALPKKTTNKPWSQTTRTLYNIKMNRINKLNQPTLTWKVTPYVNTRSCQYSMHDMTAALERSGCTVTREPPDPRYPSLPAVFRRLIATYILQPDEDPGLARHKVTRAIRITHPKAPYRFLGLSTNQENQHG